MFSGWPPWMFSGWPRSGGTTRFPDPPTVQCPRRSIGPDRSKVVLKTIIAGTTEGEPLDLPFDGPVQPQFSARSACVSIASADV
jgi:hypothetical protein